MNSRSEIWCSINDDVLGDKRVDIRILAILYLYSTAVKDSSSVTGYTNSINITLGRKYIIKLLNTNRKTVTTRLQLLEDMNYIYHDEDNYIINKLDPNSGDRFVKLPVNTFNFLMNHNISLIGFKVYLYLLNKYYVYSKRKESCSFTGKELVQKLGYCYNARNLKNITDELDNLQNLDLVKCGEPHVTEMGIEHGLYRALYRVNTV